MSVEMFYQRSQSALKTFIFIEPTRGGLNSENLQKFERLYELLFFNNNFCL